MSSAGLAPAIVETAPGSAQAFLALVDDPVYRQTYCDAVAPRRRQAMLDAGVPHVARALCLSASVARAVIRELGPRLAAGSAGEAAFDNMVLTAFCDRLGADPADYAGSPVATTLAKICQYRTSEAAMPALEKGYRHTFNGEVLPGILHMSTGNMMRWEDGGAFGAVSTGDRLAFSPDTVLPWIPPVAETFWLRPELAGLAVDLSLLRQRAFLLLAIAADDSTIAPEVWPDGIRRVQRLASVVGEPLRIEDNSQMRTGFTLSMFADICAALWLRRAGVDADIIAFEFLRQNASNNLTLSSRLKKLADDRAVEKGLDPFWGAFQNRNLLADKYVPLCNAVFGALETPGPLDDEGIFAVAYAALEAESLTKKNARRDLVLPPSLLDLLRRLPPTLPPAARDRHRAEQNFYALCPPFPNRLSAREEASSVAPVISLPTEAAPMMLEVVRQKLLGRPVGSLMRSVEAMDTAENRVFLGDDRAPPAFATAGSRSSGAAPTPLEIAVAARQAIDPARYRLDAGLVSADPERRAWDTQAEAVYRELFDPIVLSRLAAEAAGRPILVVTPDALADAAETGKKPGGDGISVDSFHDKLCELQGLDDVGVGSPGRLLALENVSFLLLGHSVASDRTMAQLSWRSPGGGGDYGVPVAGGLIGYNTLSVLWHEVGHLIQASDSPACAPFRRHHRECFADGYAAAMCLAHGMPVPVLAAHILLETIDAGIRGLPLSAFPTAAVRDALDDPGLWTPDYLLFERRQVAIYGTILAVLTGLAEFGWSIPDREAAQQAATFGAEHGMLPIDEFAYDERQPFFEISPATAGRILDLLPAGTLEIVDRILAGRLEKPELPLPAEFGASYPDTALALQRLGIRQKIPPAVYRRAVRRHKNRIRERYMRAALPGKTLEVLQYLIDEAGDGDGRAFLSPTLRLYPMPASSMPRQRLNISGIDERES